MALISPSPRDGGGFEPLACPVCRGPLDEVRGRAACAPCALQYRVDDGLYTLGPAFAAALPRTPSFEEARMGELLADCAIVGWPEAERRLAREVLAGTLAAPAGGRLARLRAKIAGATWEDVLQDLADATRAGWKYLLDLDRRSRVLVLGPTWGAVPLALARGVARVLVLDAGGERLRVVRAQADALGLDHVVVARVFDPVRLPVADAGIDVVVVPCLAAWFGAFAGRRPRAADAIVELLLDLRRTLAPGGQVYLGTDSRHGIAGVASPRRGAEAGLAPRMLKRVAARSGFGGCHLFAPLPFRHKFHQILDVDRADRMKFCGDPYRTRGRLVRSAVRSWELAGRPPGLERRLYPFLPGLAAVLTTTPVHRSFAERLLDGLASTGRIPAGARALSRYLIRPRGVVVLAGGPSERGGAFVRVPLEPRAAESCRRHHETIVALAADTRIPPALRALFPVPLADGTHEGQPFFAETARPGDCGRIYYARSARRYDRAITSAAAAVCALRRATETPVVIDAREFDRLCGDWLADLRAFVRPDAQPALAAIDEWLRATMLGATLPLGWHHGDYDLANLLFGRDDAVTGILDFEAFEPRGLPLIDLLLLLARRLIRSDGMAFGDVFVRVILTGALAPLEARIFAREAAIVGVDARMQRAIAVCAWLNHLKLRRDSWLVRSPSWLDANLHAVLHTVRSAL
ncbi:MAG: hypothetical protein IT294_08705 [Deltaproteobacteria bacterium]|nr:hypothetical protein [Deltaproteobacteria bacterium]